MLNFLFSLYGRYRGYNSGVVYSIVSKSGKLTLKQWALPNGIIRLMGFD
jgi:hypothetical protein